MEFNIKKDMRVDQLIHEAIHQFNVLFKEKDMGISLRRDIDLYDLRPYDNDTHNAGVPMYNLAVVSAYVDEDIKHIDPYSNFRCFELTLRNR